MKDFMKGFWRFLGITSIAAFLFVGAFWLMGIITFKEYILGSLVSIGLFTVLAIALKAMDKLAGID